MKLLIAEDTADLNRVIKAMLEHAGYTVDAVFDGEAALLQIEKENMKIAQERRARHDRRHHNLVLLEFANKNDIETVKDYLKTLVDDDSDSLGEINYCKNPTINTVLSVYEKKAKTAGIEVKISARTGYDIPVSPKDVVIIIANLFENAINATKKFKAKEKIIDYDIFIARILKP